MGRVSAGPRDEGRHDPHEAAIPVDGPVTIAEKEVLRTIGKRARAVNLDRARRLTELLDRAAGNALDEDERTEAQTLAHQIVGSAGTFGFAGVSELAVEVEDYFTRVVPDERRLARVRQAVAEVVEQLAPGPGAV